MSDKNEKKASSPVAKTKFTVFEKGTREFEHHLLKLMPAPMKRNTSWKFEQPTIVTLEHCHIFHTLNDKTFKPNKHCTPVGGHTHEVVVSYGKDDEGNQIITDVKCGPPLHYITKPIGGGRRVKVLEQVGWDGYTENGQKLRVTDDHRHEFEYHGLQMMTQDGQAAYRNRAKSEVSRAQSGPTNTQAARLNGLENNPEADKVRGNLKDATGQFPTEPGAQT